MQCFGSELWSKVEHYKGNRRLFGTHRQQNRTLYCLNILRETKWQKIPLHEHTRPKQWRSKLAWRQIVRLKQRQKKLNEDMADIKKTTVPPAHTFLKTRTHSLHQHSKSWQQSQTSWTMGTGGLFTTVKRHRYRRGVFSLRFSRTGFWDSY